MSPRRVAAALLVLSGALWLGVARPARREAEAARQEHRRLLEARRQARSRVERLESSDAAHRRAAGALAAGGNAVTALRRWVLDALQGAPVRGVRLEVRPAPPPAAVSLHLAAEGPSGDVLLVAGEIARPGGGLVLDTVRLTRTPGGLLLGLDALGLGARR
ncbi:MAG: hypothetical protein HY317_00420 [Acidobacteria bacterium]|nr:hypothetical protein [Acidobacteriota bacterium]